MTRTESNHVRRREENGSGSQAEEHRSAVITVILLAQILFIFIFFLNSLGINTPIITQTIGFAFLSFIPGFIILRILKTLDRNIIEVILYSMGLSIAFLMAIGVFLNAIGFLFTPSPLSTLNLMISINVIVVVFSVIVCLREKNRLNFIASTGIRDTEKCKNGLSIVVACLFPFLSVIGVCLMNFYKINTILLVFYLVLLFCQYSCLQKDTSPILSSVDFFNWVISFVFNISDNKQFVGLGHTF